MHSHFLPSISCTCWLLDWLVGCCFLEINVRFENLCSRSRGGGTFLFSEYTFSDIFLFSFIQLFVAFSVEKGIEHKPYNPIPKQVCSILWPASCCSWVRANSCTLDSTNTLDLTWYIFMSLTVFLPLMEAKSTHKINNLFPSPLWQSDFQSLQWNAKFGARRVQVSWWSISLSPGSGSVSSVSLWLGFPLNVPRSCYLVSLLLAHVLWTFAGCLYNQECISWLAYSPGSVY